MILYYFIYPAYLGSWYVRKDFSFGPWLVQRKSECGPLALVGKVWPPICIYFVLIFLRDAVL
jgi:hypothetical protein